MKHFGTDGIRALNEKFDEDYLKKVALGIASLGEDMTIVVGRDPRISGQFIENELTKTLTKYGVNIISAGMVPTPTLAFLTKLLKCNYGIMLSASHNPPEYNGIKLFSCKGEKVTEEVENSVEKVIDNPIYPPEKAGKKSQFNGEKEYIDFILSSINTDLSGIKVLLDTANGATSIIAPEIFKLAGAVVVQKKGEVDGIHINENCGATVPTYLLAEMSKSDCDIGFTYDGDGDRVMCVYKNKIYNGDHLMYVHCKAMKEIGTLVKNTMVGTVMSNLGTEKACKKSGINLVRANVGDKYVYREMVKNGYNVGGEESGHMIFSDYVPTGDGIISSLLTAKLNKVKPIDTVDDIIECPSVTDCIICDKKAVNSFKESKKIAEYLGSISSDYRMVIRPSGTEPKIRILVESEKLEDAQNKAKEIKKFIEEIIL
jgi:phosphoglucosamine mutase